MMISLEVELEKAAGAIIDAVQRSEDGFCPACRTAVLDGCMVEKNGQALSRPKVGGLGGRL